MYIADLHIHSRYSRATSRDCTPEHLELWARKKGIGIIGTGDFTHPAWRAELKEKLVPAEEGLYRLKEEYRFTDAAADFNANPRFAVTGEISSIYKKDGKVRKVHSLILLPNLEAAERLSAKLETIGNIHSDGRPILGLDCRDLLEITLTVCPDAVYVPAHIWTPHFSMFGAFSGFDTVEECYGDLTPYIHAVETGLSSDPPMNWRLSALDSYQLISNSDAHSPAKLGREANLLDIPLSYQGLADAIQKGRGLLGTIEFFPEEGKYHFDGHRKCHLCLSPVQAAQYSGKCPVCGKKLTIGVSHRVEQLADRAEGAVRADARRFESLVPLPEVIAACTGVSAAGTKVQAQYADMLERLGNEFSILREMPLEEIQKVSGRVTAEGIRRLREGRVRRIPGYDGEYGIIKLFDQAELDELSGQMNLFAMMGLSMEDDLFGQSGSGAGNREEGAAEVKYSAGESAGEYTAAKEAASASELERRSYLDELSSEQRSAVTAAWRALAVIAGPGTGKTTTLIARIRYLIEERRVKPSEITAVTFTNKAADELKERLKAAFGGKRGLAQMNVGTFHALCFQLLNDRGMTAVPADESQTLEFAQNTIREFGLKEKPNQLLRRISLMKSCAGRDGEGTASGFVSGADVAGKVPAAQMPEPDVLEHYQSQLRENGLLDFDDLLLETVSLLKAEDKAQIRGRKFSYLLVDEFQDINPLQYELIRLWNRDGIELFAIGDPDQAIYGFRGSDSACFDRLSSDYPGLLTIRLTKNYRSSPQIVTAATELISHNEGGERKLSAERESGMPVRLVTAKSEMSEGIFIAKEINRLIGGIDMLDAQGQAENTRNPVIKASGFADIAILYRTHRQADLLEMCLKTEGIPYVVCGRDDFLMEKPVRGTICFFRYLTEPEEVTAKKQCLRLLWNVEENGMAGCAFDELRQKYEKSVQKTKPVRLLEDWMADMGLSDHSAMRKLRDMALFYKTMPEMLTGLVFGQESDLKRCAGKTYTADAVTLMTLHGSKGLEYPIVMIAGVKEGMIPLTAKNRECDMEEERRLFYVGMTRAKNELILITPARESPFLAELPEENTVREESGKKKKEEAGQLSLFELLEL